MKELKDYTYLIPLWIREDPAFKTFYEGIINIFLDCQKTKEDIINSFTLENLKNYDKSLEVIASYFGISRNFYLESGNLVTSVNPTTATFNYTPGTEININIPNDILLRMIKFKLLQSNFDGTVKNLIDNFNSLFEDEINIQFLEDIKVIEDKEFPVLRLNLVINNNLTEEEATLFFNGAYSFNYLGVIVEYSLGGKTIELIWDESEWDLSNWT